MHIPAESRSPVQTFRKTWRSASRIQIIFIVVMRGVSVRIATGNSVSAGTRGV
ncbi:MAG: hypothetical protein LKF48_00740 [Prevotella sp.]|nr:hypothetical protein [Prevotella sp.]MCH4181679.1 hypothetical protein [Prevotella sp.]MCH4211953.1 hypothetical protein [Prevotella sp.]MCH4240611.1 hypothetical protein [Prevotella sp.]